MTAKLMRCTSNSKRRLLQPNIWRKASPLIMTPMDASLALKFLMLSSGLVIPTFLNRSFLRMSPSALHKGKDESCDFMVVHALRAADHNVTAILEISPRAENL